MGHAGAIISGSSGTAADKVAALNKVGIPVATSPLDLPALMAEKLKVKKAKKSASTKKTAKTTKARKTRKKSATAASLKAKKR
jgi:hypothetical protein